MIEKCPKISPYLLQRVLPKMSDPLVMEEVHEINRKYLYWSDVKYKRVASLTDTELWALVKFARLGSYAMIWPKYNISVPVTNHMQELCHYFDMNFGGSWGADSVLPEEGKERFLTSSVMEEAIASSQIEGASTTRKAAKEMLRKNKTPKNEAEQMIVNNYSAIHYIAEHKSDPLAPDFILRLHEIMTTGTLEDVKEAGAFRTSNDIVVANSLSGEVVHTPPDYSEIPHFIDDLCRFANSDSQYFLHPIIKAITIHFLIAYYHPFVDGNGRTARALFYWYMLKSGYWLTEYLSISRIIYRSKNAYEKSYLYAESDGNDIGYFITYNLRALKLAFEELKNYIEIKIVQKQHSMDILSMGGFNPRQATILSMYRDNPSLVLSINDVSTKFGISKPTAKLDLSPLVERGLLCKLPINKKQSNYVKGPSFDEII